MYAARWIVLALLAAGAWVTPRAELDPAQQPSSSVASARAARVEYVDWLGSTPWYDGTQTHRVGKETQFRVIECKADALEVSFDEDSRCLNCSSHWVHVRLELSDVGDVTARAWSRWRKGTRTPRVPPPIEVRDAVGARVVLARAHDRLTLRFVAPTLVDDQSIVLLSGGAQFERSTIAAFLEAWNRRASASTPSQSERAEPAPVPLVSLFGDDLRWYDDGFTHITGENVDCKIVSADDEALMLDVEGREDWWRPATSGVGVRLRFERDSADVRASATSRWHSEHAGESHDAATAVEGGWISAAPKHAGMEVRFWLPATWRAERTFVAGHFSLSGGDAMPFFEAWQVAREAKAR